jgi:hypothetical protein
MDNFDLRKYLAEGKLHEEVSVPTPGDKFKIEGDYYISQPNSEYNRQIGSVNGQTIHIEYVKDAPNGDGFFKVQGMKKLFRIPKEKYNKLIPVDKK